MKPYIYRRIMDNEIKALFIGIVHEEPMSYLYEIEKELNQENFQGDILIDAIMHNGNNKDRFIKIDYNGKLDLNSAVVVNLNRDNLLRKYSCNVLAEYPEIVSSSILNKFQKKLLKKRVTL